MEDSAAKAVRSKRDSSIRVASRLVRDGLAQGMVSAGNTGAVMATAKMVQGMLPGVVQIWSGYLAQTAPGWALLDGYALSICSADFNEWVWKTTSVAPAGACAASAGRTSFQV